MDFIAIDIGTSFTKGAVVNIGSHQIRSIRRSPAPPRLPSEDPLICEFDAAAIVTSVRQVIDRLLPETDQCGGILLCGQMGGLVLCSEDGEAQRPYISWMDQRSVHQHPERRGSFFDAMAEIVSDRDRAALGNEFRPGLPFSFLFYLSETGQLAPHEGAIPVTLPDYVAAALCRTRPVMEWTSTTGMLDVTRRCFPESVIRELRLDCLQWPETVDFRHIVGHCSAAGKSLPVYAPTGDHQCSLAGTLLKANELSVNISTGSQVSMLTNDTQPGNFQLRPYFDSQLLRTVTNIPAGRSLTAVLRLLTEISGDSTQMQAAWDFFFAQAAEVQQSDVRCNLAFFPGAVEGPGAFANLREDNLTVGHIARSCLEQMAVCYEQFAARISPQRNWSELVFSGGIAERSPLLRHLIKAKLQTSYRTAHTSEDALSGMMVLGRVIAGLNETVEEATSCIADEVQKNG